jgi:hypothetical protein
MLPYAHRKPHEFITSAEAGGNSCHETLSSPALNLTLKETLKSWTLMEGIVGITGVLILEAILYQVRKSDYVGLRSFRRGDSATVGRHPGVGEQ